MMQNNDILSRLGLGGSGSAPSSQPEIQKQSGTAYVDATGAAGGTAVPMAPSVNEVQNTDSVMPNERVVTARYKVYSMILIILLLFVFMDFLPSISRKHESASATLISSQATSQSLENQKNQYDRDKVYLNDIHSNVGALTNCINDQIGCSDLPVSFEKDFSVPVSYLQLSSLTNPKMPIDEKKLLKNFNEYLIKQNPFEGNARNGEIKRIAIGDAVPFEGSSVLYSVPLSVTVVFESAEDLRSFVHNVERVIIPNKEDRILYKIDQISYDIVDQNAEQESEIEMSIYYYDDPNEVSAEISEDASVDTVEDLQKELDTYQQQEVVAE